MKLPPSLTLLFAVACAGPLLNCGADQPERAGRAVGFIRAMQRSLLTANQDALGHFTERPDFEELQRIFGADALDPGTPFGPQFQDHLDQMIERILADLAKEPKNAAFPAKASKAMRHFGAWWHYERTEIEGRVKHLEAWYEQEKGSFSTMARNRFEKGLLVLGEIAKLLLQYEQIVEKCVRQIDALQQESGGW